MKNLIGICFAVLAAAAHGIAVDDARRRTIDFTRTANPIVPEGMFFCDPAARVAPDGTLWIVGTRDESRVKYWCCSYLDMLETKDLSTWKLHRSVFASKGEFDRIAESDKQMWDSNIIFHNGQWWLFYCMPDKAHMMGCASAPSPTGPYSMGRRMPECTRISPSVFCDDDGTTYFVWGQTRLHGAVLKDDYSGFVPGSLQEVIIDENRHYFHENIQLTKRNGIYYMVYATTRNGVPTSLGYSTAEKPFGPYTYRGVIIDGRGCDPDNWNIGGEIVELGGRWYVIYHHATNGSRYLRKTSVEPITFDADGMIAQVEMTSNGAGPLLDPFSETPARIACSMEGNVRVTTMPDDTERLSGIKQGDSATWRYFKSPGAAKSFVMRVVPKLGGIIELRDGKGASYGNVVVPPGDGEKVSEVSINLTRRFPEGRTAVILGCIVKDRFGARNKSKKELFDILSFRFK